MIYNFNLTGRIPCFLKLDSSFFTSRPQIIHIYSKNHILNNTFLTRTKRHDMYMETIFKDNPLYNIQIHAEFAGDYTIKIQKYYDTTGQYDGEYILEILEQDDIHDLREKIDKQDKEIQKLSDFITEIYYAPGMPGYIKSKNHFESMVQKEKEREI
jgi:hypothetical protein